MLGLRTDFILGWKIKEGFDIHEIKFENKIYDIYSLCDLLTEKIRDMKIDKSRRGANYYLDLFKKRYKIGCSITFQEDTIVDYIIGVTWVKKFDYGFLNVIDSNEMSNDFKDMRGVIREFSIENLLRGVLQLEDEIHEYMVIGVR